MILLNHTRVFKLKCYRLSSRNLTRENNEYEVDSIIMNKSIEIKTLITDNEK